MDNRGFVSDITDVIRNEGVANSRDVPSYITLKKQVEDLIVYQTEIEKKIRSENSTFRGWYNRAKIFFYKRILKRKEYTLEELFDMQLTNVDRFGANLKGVLFVSRKELEYLDNYYQKISAEFIASLDGVLEEKQKLQEKVGEYSNKKEELNTMPEKNSEYFAKEMGLNQMKKSISEGLHNYNMKNESIMDLGEEKKFLVVVSDFMRESTQLCERISTKVERMSRHVKNTKRTYDSMKRQQSTVASLYEAVDTMTKFTMQIHNLLGNGLSALANLANNSNELNNFFTTAESKLGAIITDVVEANKKKSEEVEKMVRDYLSK